MSPDNAPVLYYIHDPMCSWCWGFQPILEQLHERLPASISIQYLLGGLAPDTKEPMPEEMQQFLQQTWKKIQQQIPGTQFNFNFWSDCQPRRSTYPACRAVIAARAQGNDYEKRIILAIQQAYYSHAKNPSDESTLVQLAKILGLDKQAFIAGMKSQETEHQLKQEISFSQSLGAMGFPSLILKTEKDTTLVQLDYNNVENILEQINELVSV